MPHEEQFTPRQEDVVRPGEPAAAPEPIVEQTAAQDTLVQRRRAPAYEPLEPNEDWLEEPGELPPRPRRRLLSPIPLALIGVLLTACGFIGGVLVEKGQTSASSSAGAAASLASRFAALRGGASGAAGSGASAFAGGAGATAGSVAYVSGDTLYVTTAEGNTVKVKTSPATSVTKTVKSELKGIHPGETVAITGSTGSDGVISAESIRVGGGAGGGGFGALFGGSGAGGASGRGAAKSSGEPALFGPGG